MLVLSTARPALFNGMLRCSIGQAMIFETIDGAMENMKILICTMENLSISLNRAGRGVLGTSIGMFGTSTQTNRCRNYFNPVLEFQ